jgi:hypothetical protein
MVMVRRLLLVLASSALLVAAGCGDSHRSRLENWEAEGLWSGTTSAGTFDGVVLDTGEYWFIYGEGAVARSVVHGTGFFTRDSEWRSDDATDYFFGYDRPFASSLAATVRPEFAIDGEVFLENRRQGFSVGFAPEYRQPANPSAIIGQRVGSASTLLSSGDFTINIDAAGNLSAVIAGGCQYGGRVLPNRNGRNVFDISLSTLQTCPFLSTASGVLVFTNGRMVITAITSDRRDVLYAVAR